jgi:phosphohistidine phosphatase
MKKVVIVRHAKAVPYGYDDDFNRDLRERGKNDAKLVSNELRKQGIKPHVMISSPAVRAIKTARIFAENLEFNKKNIQEIEAIYEGMNLADFIGIIKKLPEQSETVFLFGHNPDCYNFTVNLLETTDENLPTCAAVGIDFQVDKWKQVKARSGKLAFRLIPKMFK